MKEQNQPEMRVLDFHKQIHIMKLFAKGNFGQVYQGYDRINQRLVALKRVKKDPNQNWLREKKALQMFNHPNILKLYDYIEQKNPESNETQSIYFVTQFIRGKTLRQFINSSGKKFREHGLSQRIVLKFFRQLLDGYGHIHDLQFVHQDIKTQNILVDQQQNIKIIDFGQSNQRDIEKKANLGTPIYTAPENFLEKSTIDFKKDVWSLGLVLYQMITGRQYFYQQRQLDYNAFKKFLLGHSIKVKYPQNFHPFWTEITKQMLKKNQKSRQQIHEIKFRLQQKLPQLLNRLEPQNKLLDIKNINLKIKIRDSNPLTQSQNQFQLSRTKKYLKYFYQKHRFLILVGQVLTKYSYPFISNAHKLIIVFLSFQIYLASINGLLKRISNNRILISGYEVFNIQTFEQPYKSLMISHLNQYREYYQKQARHISRKMIQKIIPPFKDSSIEDLNRLNQQQVVLTDRRYPYPSQLIQEDLYHPVKMLIYSFNIQDSRILPKKQYIKVFKQVICNIDFYKPTDIIREYFYPEDMIVYYLFLIIANLDQYINWNNDYFGDQIPKLRQKIKAGKWNQEEIQELLARIEFYNQQPSQNFK